MTRFVRASSLALVLAACGGGDVDPVSVCVPGTTMACVCSGGASGGQACLGDGSGYGACECGATQADAGEPEDMGGAMSPDMSIARDMNVVAADMDVQLDASTPDLGADMAVPTARLSAEFAFPGLVRDPSVVGGLEAAFPTYVAHLFGTWAVTAESLDDFTSFFPQTTCVEVTNSGDASGMGQIEVRMPGYSDPSTQNVTVPAGESRVVCVNPTFNLTTLYGLSSPANGRIEVAFRVGGTEVASEMVSTRILPVTYVVWQLNDTLTLDSLNLARVLSSVYVQKDDPSIRASLTEVTSRVNYSGSTGASGYNRGPRTWPSSSTTYSLLSGYHQLWYVYLEEDESIEWRLDQMSGGVSNFADVALFREDQYVAWMDGDPSAVAWWSLSQTTGSSGGFGAEYSAGFSSGWHVFVVKNNTSNGGTRNLRVTRTPSRQEIVWDSMTAIFDALRARGVTYTSITDTFFVGTQNVRRVGQVFGEGTANCVDGTFVFASYLEAMGLEPVLIYVSGHAFVGTRSQPRLADDTPAGLIWPIETTMVGGAGSAEDAINSAMSSRIAASTNEDPFWVEVNVANARTRQVLPQPR